jgi:hypothetical protein
VLIRTSAVDPMSGRLYQAGAAKILDPSGGSSVLIRTSAVDPTPFWVLTPADGIAAVDPTNGIHLSPAGWAKMVDNCCRITE